MRALVLALAIGLAGVAPATSGTKISSVPQVNNGDQLAFPFISVCAGDAYVNYGGVGGGGGHMRMTVHYPSIFGCPV